MTRRACTPSACTAATSFSETLRPLPVCDAEMTVSDSAGAAAAAGAMGVTPADTGASCGCAARACAPGRFS
ncbi:MAG TPA: hypothetical protein VF033_02675 [Steroidobacteraceae bacterium]